ASVPPLKLSIYVLTARAGRLVREAQVTTREANADCPITAVAVLNGRQPSDPHHLQFAQPRALGLKVSDEFTVPLCRRHHRHLQELGNEKSWWANLGIGQWRLPSTCGKTIHYPTLSAQNLSITERRTAPTAQEQVNRLLIQNNRTACRQPNTRCRCESLDVESVFCACRIYCFPERESAAMAGANTLRT